MRTKIIEVYYVHSKKKFNKIKILWDATLTKHAVLLQAIWKPVIMRVRNISVEDEHREGNVGKRYL